MAAQAIVEIANATIRKKVVVAKRCQMGQIVEQNGMYRLRIRTDGSDGRRKHLSVKIGRVGEITKAERLRKQIEIASKFNSSEYLNKVSSVEETFEKQAQIWLATLKCKPATKVSAISTLTYHVNPLIGHMPLSEVRNGAMRKIVDEIARKGLSRSMMDQAFKFVRMVKKSALTDDLEERFPYTFNRKAIFAGVDTQEANRPCPSSEEVTKMISAATGWLRTFLILAAASGLRFGELLGLEIRDFDGSSVRIRQSVWRGETQSPKTSNARRIVDLHPDVCNVLRRHIGDRQEGFIFIARHQGSVTDKVYRLQSKLGIQKSGMHAFRRFRTTHLRKIGTPEGVLNFWLGWSTKKSMADHYDRISEDNAFRQSIAKEVGFGFTIPADASVPAILGEGAEVIDSKLVVSV